MLTKSSNSLFPGGAVTADLSSASTNRHFLSSYSPLSWVHLQDDAANRMAGLIWVRNTTKSGVKVNGLSLLGRKQTCVTIQV